MFDIGFGEMILLAAIALVAIGPKQLPEVARVVGRMLNEFRRATGDLTKTLVDARDSTNHLLSETQKSVVDAVTNHQTPSPPATPPAPQPTEPQTTFDLAGAAQSTSEKKES